ncbi:MAG: DNA-formamidopyrimidine glycosylase [Peptococcaceae bacterium]|nr:DNA-formamidopyrimidine glycosylase [Peptococcaceae bacterium]
MPELPEVETIIRGLRKNILGARILGVEIYLPKVVATPEPDLFKSKLKGKQINTLKRRGKYILVYLSDNSLLAFHLRMTGQLVFHKPGYNEADFPKHTHLVFRLDRGLLRFTDPRQFGRVWLVPKDKPEWISGLTKLGPEPLDDTFTEERFKDKIRQHKQKIKPLLLDQAFIAGLGNIYTDEALYRARIHPAKRASDLTARETETLYRAIKEVLSEGIKYKGTSVRDYVDGTGDEGHYQERLAVYGKKGMACYRCGTPISRILCANRGTYYCPRCQKLT